MGIRELDSSPRDADRQRQLRRGCRVFRFVRDQGPLDMQCLLELLCSETEFDASQRTIERDVRALIDEGLIAYDSRARLVVAAVTTVVGSV